MYDIKNSQLTVPPSWKWENRPNAHDGDVSDRELCAKPRYLQDHLEPIYWRRVRLQVWANKHRGSICCRCSTQKHHCWPRPPKYVGHVLTFCWDVRALFVVWSLQVDVSKYWRIFNLVIICKIVKSPNYKPRQSFPLYGMYMRNRQWCQQYIMQLLLYILLSWWGTQLKEDQDIAIRY